MMDICHHTQLGFSPLVFAGSAVKVGGGDKGEGEG